MTDLTFPQKFGDTKRLQSIDTLFCKSIFSLLENCYYIFHTDVRWKYFHIVLELQVVASWYKRYIFLASFSATCWHPTTSSCTFLPLCIPTLQIRTYLKMWHFDNNIIIIYRLLVQSNNDFRLENSQQR